MNIKPGNRRLRDQLQKLRRSVVIWLLSGISLFIVLRNIRHFLIQCTMSRIFLCLVLSESTESKSTTKLHNDHKINQTLRLLPKRSSMSHAAVLLNTGITIYKVSANSKRRNFSAWTQVRINVFMLQKAWFGARRRYFSPLWRIFWISLEEYESGLA